jgi:hypothetical protein
MLDTIIPGLANLALTLGIGFAALGAQRLADYTFATGLLLHLTVWFDEWSTAKRAPLADRKDLLH